jgi:hypothetical protein
MRAQLAALAGVQPALEQGAQEGGIDLRPVQFRRADQQVDVVAVKRQRRCVIEQSTVEPWYGSIADLAAAFGHGGEQVAGVALRPVRPLPRPRQQLDEQPRRQQPDIVGEQAEHQPIDEMRHHKRVVPPIPQPPGELGELAGRFLGQCLPRACRAQLVGVRERPFQQPQPLRVRQFRQRDRMGLGDRVGPVGADDDPRDVGDDQ